MVQPHSDMYWMKQALHDAALGEGYVEPNPMVGCVLVSDNTMIGRGHHARFGGPHAEVVAIADARRRGHADRLADCTAYVTLEPCCHFGKTPPCTEALRQARVRRVVVAMSDPYREVMGQGISWLRKHGLIVDVGIGAIEARRLTAPYLKRVESGLPWLIAKWAMSLDGKIATKTGHSQWISCEESRRQVHQLRARVDAVMVGSGTALADDPQLTARNVSIARQALRVVVDSRLRLPLESQLVRSAKEFATLVWTGPEADLARMVSLRDQGVEVIVSEFADRDQRLKSLLHFLASERNLTNVLVEGGSQLMGALLDAKLIDQCEVFVAPRLIGGAQAVSAIAGCGADNVEAGLQLDTVVTEACGSDLHISCRTMRSNRPNDLPN